MWSQSGTFPGSFFGIETAGRLTAWLHIPMHPMFWYPLGSFGDDLSGNPTVSRTRLEEGVQHPASISTNFAIITPSGKHHQTEALEAKSSNAWLPDADLSKFLHYRTFFDDRPYQLFNRTNRRFQDTGADGLEISNVVDSSYLSTRYAPWTDRTTSVACSQQNVEIDRDCDYQSLSYHRCSS
jgi:hypothetical protein